MKNRTLLNVLVVMLMSVILLGIAQSAKADVKGTENFYAWDRTTLSFRNSTADIYFDGTPVEVFSQLSYDSDLYTTVAADASSCGVGAQTSFAGRVTLRFDHTDASPAGALGMKESQAWQLVDCDFDGNGTVDNADRLVDLGANPPTEYTTAEFTLISIDEVVAVGGAVQTEIVTTMFANIDSDCDNSIADEPLPTGGVVCFFAQGVTPTLAEAGPPYWNNANLQAGFGGSSGVKTVNLKPYGPTAITLENLAAQSPGGVHPGVWLAIIVLVAAIAIVLIREGRQGQFMTIRKDED